MSLFKFPEVVWSDDPFPHAVVTNAFDSGLLQDCHDEFPAANDSRWVTYNDPEEIGKKAGGSNMWGLATQHFFDLCRSNDVVKWLETSTGIADLVADDIGGGMHETGGGGRLEMHVDFNVHPSNAGLERRINMLTFLSPVWDVNWGGLLKLTRPGFRTVEIAPIFGTTVLFECSDMSFHGHPDPVVGDHLRRSLACYYYAPSRVAAGAAHSTIWNPDAP